MPQQSSTILLHEILDRSCPCPGVRKVFSAHKFFNARSCSKVRETGGCKADDLIAEPFHYNTRLGGRRVELALAPPVTMADHCSVYLFRGAEHLRLQMEGKERRMLL